MRHKGTARTRSGHHEEAARSVGIGTATLLRWQKEPEFQQAYRAACRAAHGQSIARLQQATSAAVSTLLKVMVDGGTPASTKVRAADSVLNHSAKAIEIEDIEARVSELERAAELKFRRAHALFCIRKCASAHPDPEVLLWEMRLEPPSPTPPDAGRLAGE